MDMENGKTGTKAFSNGQLVKKNNNLIFFLNGELHRVVRTNASGNVCHAFNYHQNKVVKYTYYDYKKFRKPAFRISEVSKILRRHEDRIRIAIWNLDVSKPYMVEYKNRSGVYYFSEENIYELRDYFANVHRGRPRNDGIVVSKNVPTISEIDAVLGKKPMLYMRTKEGNFVPVWSAEEYE
jgi:hypothetical protein